MLFLERLKHEYGFKQKSRKVFYRGNYLLRVLSFKRVIIFNNDPDIKHNHIATCLVPKDSIEMDTLFELLEIQKP